MNNLIPIFRIFDLSKAREFYLDYLDFSIDWQHQFHDDAPVYMQVSRNGSILHLSEHHGDACPGSSVRILVEDIDAFHQALQAKQYKYLNPGILDQTWGCREIMLNDPFGNKLIFYVNTENHS